MCSIIFTNKKDGVGKYMKKNNNKKESRMLAAILLFVILFSMAVSDKISYSQIQNNTFVAIFKDTLFEKIDANVITADIIENEIRRMIAKDSLITLSGGKDTIWTFDITLSGRRCYGTIFSGPTITGIMKTLLTYNIIYLYSSSDINISRLLNGLFIYVSEDANWKFRLKSE
jgi:hypothetical protein